MNTTGKEYFARNINGVGVFFMDGRAVRSWHRDVSGNQMKDYLGPVQWDFLLHRIDKDIIGTPYTTK